MAARRSQQVITSPFPVFLCTCLTVGGEGVRDTDGRVVHDKRCPLTLTRLLGNWIDSVERLSALHFPHPFGLLRVGPGGGEGGESLMSSESSEDTKIREGHD